MQINLRSLFKLACISVMMVAPVLAGGYRRPVNLKLLVLATTGDEVGLSAIRSFLDYQGTPYDVVKLAAGESLPALRDAERGFYQGVILTLGNLGVCNPNCHSALDPPGWARLDAYLQDFGVRLLSYYTYPEARYGMAPGGGVATTDERPLMAEFTPEAATVFRDLRLPGTLRIANAYTYLAQMTADEGEITRPLLRTGSHVLAAIHEKPDGREFLSLTFDNNPELLHSLVLQRGLIDWVTRGVHLGWRKAWLMPQVDDLFLSNYLFDLSVPECATNAGPAAGPDGQIPCQKLRIEGADLEAVAQRQSEWQAKPQFNAVRVSLAYNGFGVKTDDDELLASAKRLAGNFFWVSHTFSHRHLDCYASGTEGCRGANTEEGATEVTDNRAAGQRFGLPLDELSLITPQISGLDNPEFLRGAARAGIRYLVSDTSRAEFLPSIPNTGLRSKHEPAIFLIPRRPTAIFYNASDAAAGRFGSETDEYNFLFGPSGQFRRPDGQPFFATDQQYAELIQREAELTVKYLLRGEMYPLMFHQANLWRYTGNFSLLTDLIGTVLARYEAISSLPVLSEQQTRVGEMLEERMAYWQAGVKATFWPLDNSVTIQAARAASVPMTGVCEAQCEEYGPFRVASVRVPAGETRTVRIAPRDFIPH